MKIKIVLKEISAITLSLISIIQYANAYSMPSKSKERETKSYSQENLDAQSYYNAALNGEFVNSETTKEPFLFSSLKRVGMQTEGLSVISGGQLSGIYKDLNNDTWYVKSALGSPANEYLCSKIMSLFIGPFVPEIKLFFDQPKLTASKLLPNFIIERKSDPHKPVVGALELELAMDLVGLTDRNSGNQGYIDLGDTLQAARVDLDYSFKFTSIDKLYLNNSRLSKLTSEDLEQGILTVERFMSVPDEQILYVLGEAYTDLLEAGCTLDQERLEPLGEKLISRRNQLIDHFYNIFPTLLNKRKNDITNLKAAQLLSEKFPAKKPQAFLDALNDGHIDIVKFFLEQDLNDQQKSSALANAAEKGHIEIVKIFIQNGLASKIETAFTKAAAKGHKDIIELLLEFTTSKEQLYALRCSCNSGSIDITKMLLEYNPTLASIIPLEFGFSNFEILKLLLDYGADPNAQNSSAFLYAFEYGHDEIVKLLLEYGADPSVIQKP